MDTKKQIPAPIFRVIVCVGAHTEKQAARVKEQVQGMFAGADVVIEANEDKPVPGAQAESELRRQVDELQQALGDAGRAQVELTRAYEARGLEIDDLKKSALERPAAAPEPIAESEFKAPKVEIGDVLFDIHVAGATATVVDIDPAGIVFVDTNDAKRVPIKFEDFPSCFEIAPAKLDIPANTESPSAKRVGQGMPLDANDAGAPASKSSEGGRKTRKPRSTAAPKRVRKPTAKK